MASSHVMSHRVVAAVLLNENDIVLIFFFYFTFSRAIKTGII